MHHLISLSLFLITGIALSILFLAYLSFVPFKSFQVPKLRKEAVSPPDFSHIFREGKTEDKRDLSNIRLLATITGSIKMALVEIDGEVQTVRIGSLVGGYRVVDIKKNYILIDTGIEKKAIGFSFLSSFGESVKGPSTTSQQSVISKREIESITSDPGIMFRQIRLVPYVQNGQTKGFLFEWVEPSSIFSRIGIRPGDVLISINNQTINTGEDAFRILQTLRNESSLKVSLLREGQPLEISLRVE